MSRLYGRGSRRRKEQIRRLVTLGAASRRRVGTLFVVEADLSEQRREHHSSRAWYCAGAQEDAMSKAQKPLKPDDFPVNAEGKKIKKQDGTPIANTDDPAVAADVAERLNDDEARREEDKWSA
jgi:hypothetical protein